MGRPSGSTTAQDQTDPGSGSGVGWGRPGQDLKIRRLPQDLPGGRERAKAKAQMDRRLRRTGTMDFGQGISVPSPYETMIRLVSPGVGEGDSKSTACHSEGLIQSNLLTSDRGVELGVTPRISSRPQREDPLSLPNLSPFPENRKGCNLQPLHVTTSFGFRRAEDPQMHCLIGHNSPPHTPPGCRQTARIRCRTHQGPPVPGPGSGLLLRPLGEPVPRPGGPHQTRSHDRHPAR